MFRTTRPDVFDDLDNTLGKSSFRRDALKRLAALGLVAAGGLVPLAAGAKDKQGEKGGKRGGHAHGDPGNRGGGGGVGAQNVEIPDPTVAPPANQSMCLVIGQRRLDDTYRVTVAGTISFNAELLTLMRAGRYFGLTCQLWSWKRQSSGVFGYRFVADMKNPKPFLTWGGSGATATAPFSWAEDRVASRLLNVNLTDPDFIHARLYIWTRAPGASEFKRYARSDGREYFKLDTVQGNF